MKEKTSLVKEFKTFIARGNVIDLAVGIIIGSAFTSIVNSLVKEIIMPPIGLVVGKVNFSDLKLVLQPAIESSNTPEVAILYGSFLQQLLNFLIVATVVFFLVKGVNALKKKEEKVEKSKKKELTEIEMLKRIEKAIKIQK
jgi:large conductance mechanosensitive channel